MKILVDENIPLMTVKALRSKGYDVRDIRGTGDQGIQDADLWQIAQQEKRLLITTDKGFSSQRYEEYHVVFTVQGFGSSPCLAGSFMRQRSWSFLHSSFRSIKSLWDIKNSSHAETHRPEDFHSHQFQFSHLFADTIPPYLVPVGLGTEEQKLRR
jgi:hypothetical protein